MAKDERVNSFICDDYARYCFSLTEVNAIAKRLDAQLSNINMQVTPIPVRGEIRYLVSLKKY